MSWRTILINSFEALTFYRRRSVITILSLAWAVASFLVLMSYGGGFDRALKQGFRSIGQDIVFMNNGQTSEQAGGMRSGRTIRLERDDVEAIRERVPYVAAISAEMMHNATITRGTRQKEYMLRGVYPEYSRIRNMKMKKGRWLTSEDDRYGRRIAVAGATVARELFGKRPPVGEEVTINGVPFTIVGVLEVKVQLANYNTPDNECLFLPYQSMELFRTLRYPDNLVWTPVSPDIREKALTEVRNVLAALHRFSPSDEKAVFILAFSQFTNLIEGMSIALNLLLAFIGTVTLGIGAVGLANIMFTSVIERTREIGVLKALGARRRTILAQFLWEAVFIVLIGGVLGVLLGVAVAGAVGSLPFMGAILGEELSREYGRIHFQISPVSILVSLGVLFAVGLIAGMLPAFRASRLDPVESLRYE